tara:strand:- start:4254 stop:4553 length:300 start_codon:yes stop_codon:yes gene_type:complete
VFRKAGERCSNEVSPETFQAIFRHLQTDGVDDQAANQMSAKIAEGDPDFESSIEQYERNLANYKEKGFNEHAAQAMAVQSLETGENPDEKTRFARIHLS